MGQQGWQWNRNSSTDLRVTDEDTMELAEMVLGKVNKEPGTDGGRVLAYAPSVISGKDGGTSEC